MLSTPNDAGPQPVEPKAPLVRDSAVTPSRAHKRKAHSAVDEERHWKSARTSGWLSEQTMMVQEEQYLSAGSAAAVPIELEKSYQSSGPASRGPVASKKEVQAANRDKRSVPNGAQAYMRDAHAVRNRADGEGVANPEGFECRDSASSSSSMPPSHLPFTHFSTGELARRRDERMILHQALLLTVNGSYEMFHRLAPECRKLVPGLIDNHEFLQAAMQKFYSDRFVERLNIPDRVALQFALQREGAARAFCLSEGDVYESYCRTLISSNRRLRRDLRLAFKTALNPKSV